MLKKYRLPILIALTFGLNVIIFFRAESTIEGLEKVLAECARNSGRTSAALNLAMLFMLGFFGLKSIYRDESKKNIFRILMTIFAVNHLIHFFFVSRYFDSQLWELDIPSNLQGFVTFIFILIVPIAIWTFKRLNKVLYFVILAHFFNVTYFISKSFYSRYKPEDPAYLHRLGILIMIGALLYIVYRVIRDWSTKLEPMISSLDNYQDK
ncbi:MAG: hypothetical protein ACI9JN_002684 [Bacteroidia bacterium]|jgi:hypothetical protein